MRETGPATSMISPHSCCGECFLMSAVALDDLHLPQHSIGKSTHRYPLILWWTPYPDTAGAIRDIPGSGRSPLMAVPCGTISIAGNSGRFRPRIHSVGGRSLPEHVRKLDA